MALSSLLHVGGHTEEVMTFPGCHREGTGKGELCLPPPRSPHSLLHDQGEAVLALKGVIELDQVHVAELVHDVDLILHILLVEPEGEEFPRNGSG